jgi:hypothetical protein
MFEQLLQHRLAFLVTLAIATAGFGSFAARVEIEQADRTRRLLIEIGLPPGGAFVRLTGPVPETAVSN